LFRSGPAARSGRRRRDCAGAGWHPLGASASAADIGRGSRSEGTSHRPGREPVVGHALDRAARHRRPARPHRPPCGLGWSARPVHRGLPVRPAGRGASRGRPAEGRAAAGRFDVADSYAPSWWAPGRTRGRARYPAREPAAGPAAGQDPAGATETRASGARTPRSRQAEPRPGRVITALIPKCDVFSADMPGIGITLTRWGVP